MPELVPGYDTQQIVETVNNSDTDINDAITAKALDGWLLGSLTLSGTDVILLFTRNVEIVS